MTVVSRTFRSIPYRSAVETWSAIVDILAPKAGAARDELKSVSGTACSLITEGIMNDSPIIVHGSGPRVRIYCLFDDKALEGDGASEASLPFAATEGNWNLSLPSPELDLDWVGRALKAKSKRITARDQSENVDDSSDKTTAESMSVDAEAFLKL